MKPTPGPWEAVYFVEGQWHIFPVNRTDYTLPIAVIDRSRDGHVETRTVTAPADAHLMAATWDLYDGCNALLGLLQLIRDRDDVSDDLAEILSTSHRVKEAEQAIAKAQKGE